MGKEKKNSIIDSLEEISILRTELLEDIEKNKLSVDMKLVKRWLMNIEGRFDTLHSIFIDLEKSRIEATESYQEDLKGISMMMENLINLNERFDRSDALNDKKFSGLSASLTQLFGNLDERLKNIEKNSMEILENQKRHIGF